MHANLSVKAMPNLKVARENENQYQMLNSYKVLETITGIIIIIMLKRFLVPNQKHIGNSLSACHHHIQSKAPSLKPASLHCR